MSDQPPMRCTSHGLPVERHVINGQEVWGCPRCLGLEGERFDKLARPSGAWMDKLRRGDQ